MDFLDVMRNLAIGIVSGIFSSIIVSVVFYILDQCRSELNAAENIVYPLYGIVALHMVKDASEDFGRKKAAQHYFEEALENFSHYKPEQFHSDLKNAVGKIAKMLQDGEVYCSLKAGIIEDRFVKRLKKQLDIINECGNNFFKFFIKRVVQNEVLWCTCAIFVIIVFLSCII